MKTTDTTTRKSLPTPIRFTAYLVAVAAFCFLNWTVLKAGDPVEYHSAEFKAELAEAIAEDTETELIVENWMLGFDEATLADNDEIQVEEWMLGYDEVTLTAREEEIEVEEWMLGYDEVTLAAREDVEVEEWMLGYDDVTLAENNEVQTETWMYDYRVYAQTGADEPRIALEDWMVDFSSWGNLIMLATK
jgi:hypothetical protein